MYRMRRGFSGFGDCGNPPLLSDFQAGAGSCTLGQGAATAACLAAQDNNEQQFILAQAAWNACKGDVEQGGAPSPNQIIGVPGQGPTETLEQAATQIYGSTPAGQAQVAQAFSAPAIQPPPTAPPSPPPTTPQAPPAATTVISSSPTPSGAPIVINSGGGAPPSQFYNSSAVPQDTSAQTSGFSLSTIPWWGWAAAAGVALVAFSGKR